MNASPMNASPMNASHMNQDTARSIPRTIGYLVAWAVTIWLALFGCGKLLTGPLSGQAWERRDGWVDRWLAGHRQNWLNTATHIGTTLAETITVTAIAIVAFIVLRLVTYRWRPSMFVAAALIGEVTIFVSTTLVVDRARPDVHRLDNAPPTSSFPSGHMAASVTLYGSLAILAVLLLRRQWLRTVAVAIAVAVPLIVGFSRLYRGMHFPSDVLAGALLALIWLTVCVKLIHPAEVGRAS